MKADSGVGSKTGTLFVVATPIGNLEDITLRAARILGDVDLVAAEDTRHSRKLLSHLGIHVPMVSYFKDREVTRAQMIIERLLGGEDVALVSDAGTPAISDPGAILVDLALASGVKVVPVPGPSALAAAMSVAGFKGGGMVFHGFLPARKKERRHCLAEYKGLSSPMMFYESPRRVAAALADCLLCLGDRKVFVGRELTKIHEELFHGRISEAIAALGEKSRIRGEFVVVVDGVPRPDIIPHDPAHLPEILRWCRDEQAMSMRDAVRKISRDLGMSRSAVYAQALKSWDKTDSEGGTLK